MKFRIVREVFTDGSIAFNVVGSHGADNELQCLVLAAESESHANSLLREVNRCAWIDCDARAVSVAGVMVQS